GAASERAVDVDGELDVRPQTDFVAVERARGQRGERVQLRLELALLAFELAVLDQLLFVRVDDDDAAVAVDDDAVATADLGRDVAAADNRRDSQRAGGDGGVA